MSVTAGTEILPIPNNRVKGWNHTEICRSPTLPSPAEDIRREPSLGNELKLVPKEEDGFSEQGKAVFDA